MRDRSNNSEAIAIASIIDSQIKKYLCDAHISESCNKSVHGKLEALQAAFGNVPENALDSDCQTRGAAMAQIELAKMAYYSGKYFQALNAFREVLWLCETAGFLYGQAIARHYLGTIHRIAENPEQAHHFYQQALIEFQSINQNAWASECVNNLGILFLWQGEYERAFSCFEKALAFLGDAPEWHIRAFVDLNRSEFFTETGDYRMAANVAAYALGLLFRSRSAIGTARISKLFGRIFRESGDIDLAKTFYELSIELYRAMNIPLGLANCYAEFGNLLQSQGMQSDSDCMLQQADAIYRNLGLQICSKTSSSVDLRK